MLLKLTINIHRALRQSEDPEKINGEIEEAVELKTALINILEKYPTLCNEIFLNENIKPGILIFSGNRELSTLGLLDDKLEEDIEVKIVPIMHGGS